VEVSKIKEEVALELEQREEEVDIDPLEILKEYVHPFDVRGQRLKA